MRVILVGACGRMGREIQAALDGADAVLAAGVDILADENDRDIVRSLSAVSADADVIMDFSRHDGTRDVCAFASEKGLPLVLGTTGQTDAEKECVTAAARKIPVFFSANMARGVFLILDFIGRAAQKMPDADIEIVETHHKKKTDAPSGTAREIFDVIKRARADSKLMFDGADAGIHSLRLGDHVGRHEVIFCTESEEITVSHTALTRRVFAEGALEAAKFIIGKPPGLYGMAALLGGGEK